MKYLNFVFKNDESVLINSRVLYRESDDHIIFNIENNEFVISPYKDSFFVKKETKDDIFVLSSNETFIQLKNENVRFDLKVTVFDCKFEDNNIMIGYSLESEEGVIKTIEITFEK